MKLANLFKTAQTNTQMQCCYRLFVIHFARKIKECMKIVVTNGRFNLHLSANTLHFAITVSKLYSCDKKELHAECGTIPVQKTHRKKAKRDVNISES